MPVNAEVERLFGYARDELFGRPIDILVPAIVRANHAMHRDEFVVPASAPHGTVIYDEITT